MPNQPTCPHTPGMPVRSCGLCLEEGNYTLAPGVTRSTSRGTPSTSSTPDHPLRARFTGECLLCDKGVKVGEMIQAVDGGYVHYHHTGGTQR